MKLPIAARRLPLAALVAVVIVALGLRIGFGLAKTVFHVDEGISLGITDAGWPSPDARPYAGKWLDKIELERAVFSANLAKGGVDYGAIWKATAADVHPPLFYWAYATMRAVFGWDDYEAAALAMNCLLFLGSAALFILITRRFIKDPYLVAAALAIFAFSSATISETNFIRMYELLQACAMLFLWSAASVLFPKGGERGPVARALPFAGLFLSCFLGLLTQYYFLFLLPPVGLFALVWLLIKKRPWSLIVGIGAIAAGLALAYSVFPPMEQHLTTNYRATQMASNLAKNVGGFDLSSLGAFLGMVSENLVGWYLWVMGIVAAVAIAVARKVSAKARELTAASARAEGFPLGPFAAMAILASAFTLVVISLSAPYLTARYIVAFFPLYALGFCALMARTLDLSFARILLGGAAVIALVHGVLPGKLLGFHEDYALDEAPAYMSDALPVAIVSTDVGFGWKNMLPYIDIPRGKKVYVSIAAQTDDVDSALAYISSSTGVKEFHAFVDDFFYRKSSLAPEGRYGFFDVVKWAGEEQALQSIEIVPLEDEGSAE